MQKPASLFSQILSEIFTAVNFDNLVAKWGAERHAKGFRSKTQLISMLFRHLVGADSLREIAGGLGCCNGKLVHLGIKEPPRRSTLSYAISRRPTRCFSSRVGRLGCSSTTIAKRMKDNCVYTVKEVRTPPRNKYVLSDEIVRLTGTWMEKKYPEPLRRITAENPETGGNIVLLT